MALKKGGRILKGKSNVRDNRAQQTKGGRKKKKERG